MKRMIFLLSLLISIQLYAQQWSIENRPRETIVYDTIYHPFYNHLQIIEIKTRETNPIECGFIETSILHEMPASIPTYIVRNDQGEILSTYNTSGRKFHSSFFLSVEKLEGRFQMHKKKVKNTSTTTGNDNSGYNILYPVYESKNNNDQSVKSFRVGLMDSLGNMCFPVEFDHIQWIDSVFIAQKEGRFFLYDHQFKQIVPHAYEEINYINTSSNHILVKQDGKYGLMNRSGEMLIPFEYTCIKKSEVFSWLPGCYALLQNDKWGFIGYDFKKYMPPFSPTSDLKLRDGYFIYHDKSGVWTAIDSSGKILTQSPLQITAVLSKNRFIVFKFIKSEIYEGGYKYDYSICDEKGNILTHILYDGLSKMNKNTVIAGYDAYLNPYSKLRNCRKWTLLDSNGNTKIKKIYSGMEKITDKWLKAYLNGECIVIDDNGNKVLDFTVDDIYAYSDHVFMIRKNDKKIFLDLQNPKVMSKEYESNDAYIGNMIAVMNNQKWGFIDSTFKEIIPLMYDQVGRFMDGMTTVKVNDKWLVMDKLGHQIADTFFNQTKLLGQGYCQVGLKGKYGIIDLKGNYVVPLEYDEIRSVIKKNNNYFILVKKYNKYGIINIKNEILYPIIYESCGEISYASYTSVAREDGYYASMTIVKRDVIEHYYLNFNKEKDQVNISENHTKGFKKVSASNHTSDVGPPYGIVNWDGKIVVPCIYNNIDNFKNFTFRIYTNTEVGLVDTMGNILIPPQYKYLYDVEGKSGYIRVGRHTGTWGLYTYQGRKIADTLYGGFGKPVFGLIPFYANFNHRYKEDQGWVSDKKQIGFMNSEGKIIIDAIYDEYKIPNHEIEEIILIKDGNSIKVNAQGKVLEEVLIKPEIKIKDRIKKKKPKKIKRGGIKWL